MTRTCESCGGEADEEIVSPTTRNLLGWQCACGALLEDAVGYADGTLAPRESER